MKHFISLDQVSRQELESILATSHRLKHAPRRETSRPLEGRIWALLFSKSSTRTRVSFEVGIRQLGGQVLFLSARELQLGRGEPIKDTARVLGRMVHGAVIRTYDHDDILRFAKYARIPTVNALSDHAHPCQILADLYTIREKLGSCENRVITFVGDGRSNIATSWIYAAAKFNFELRIAAPRGFQPDPDLLTKGGDRARVTDDLASAAAGADVLYTDVWVSMGQESESEERIRKLEGYQINEQIVSLAKPNRLVLHCLPAYRGKEITEETLEGNAGTIFDQAENRLHVQKGILSWMVS